MKKYYVIIDNAYSGDFEDKLKFFTDELRQAQNAMKDYGRDDLALYEIDFEGQCIRIDEDNGKEDKSIVCDFPEIIDDPDDPEDGEDFWVYSAEEEDE